MGHPSITVTLDRYGHPFPGSEAQAARLLDAYLKDARERARRAEIDPCASVPCGQLFVTGVNVGQGWGGGSYTTRWVGHPVTVDAAASAGPSGIGGMVCNKDGGGADQSYPAGGVKVDGDGVHTVSCAAWNQAEGPTGSGATGTRSLAVRIDEAPPTTQFEPQNPGDPTGLVVDTNDNESGVAGGQIEMRPASVCA